MAERVIGRKLHSNELISAKMSQQIGRLFLHAYNLKGVAYVRFSYHKDSSMTVAELYKHCILVEDVAEVIGGAMYAKLRRDDILNLDPDPKLAVRYLDPIGLQEEINAAFEPSERAFDRLAECYEAKTLKRAKNSVQHALRDKQRRREVLNGEGEK